MTSPTFVARFADGEVTRMTTHTSPYKLDVGRGIRLSRSAYRARKQLKPETPTPEVVEASYVSALDGSTLKAYDAAALAEHRDD